MGVPAAINVLAAAVAARRSQAGRAVTYCMQRSPSPPARERGEGQRAWGPCAPRARTLELAVEAATARDLPSPCLPLLWRSMPRSGMLLLTGPQRVPKQPAPPSSPSSQSTRQRLPHAHHAPHTHATGLRSAANSLASGQRHCHLVDAATHSCRASPHAMSPAACSTYTAAPAASAAGWRHARLLAIRRFPSLLHHLTNQFRAAQSCELSRTAVTCSAAGCW